MFSNVHALLEKLPSISGVMLTYLEEKKKISRI